MLQYEGNKHFAKVFKMPKLENQQIVNILVIEVEPLIANLSLVYRSIHVFRLTVVAREGLHICGIITSLKGLF